MARQRFIHPDIWSDPTVGTLSPIERLFFIGCFSNADDEGRLLGNAAFLRSTIFPYDDLTIQDVTEMRDRVTSVCENLVYYIVDGIEYLAFIKWSAYQKPRYAKPSKLPEPPDSNTDETFQLNSVKDGSDAPGLPQHDRTKGKVPAKPTDEALQLNICKPSAELEPDGGKPASLDRVWVGLGREVVGETKPAAAESAIEDDSVSPIRFYEQTFGNLCPPTSLEVLDEFEAKGLEPSALKWAMREQRLSDGRGPKYLRSILQRLHDNGLLTAAAAEAHERERRQGQASSRASPDDDSPGLSAALRSARRRLQEAEQEATA